MQRAGAKHVTARAVLCDSPRAATDAALHETKEGDVMRSIRRGARAAAAIACAALL